MRHPKKLRFLSTRAKLIEFSERHNQCIPAQEKDRSSSSAYLLSCDKKVFYPFRLNAELPLKKFSFWNEMKKNHLKNIGSTRLKGRFSSRKSLIFSVGLLKDEAYNFPYQFYTDATETLINSFGILSDPNQMKSGGCDLDQVMIASLADTFKSGFESLHSNDLQVEFIWHEKPKISLDGFYFTYGPFPVPDGYLNQDWLDFITYVVPKEDAEFQSQPRQQEVAKNAEKAGCYIRIDTVVDCDLEFVVKSLSGNIPLLREHRKRLEVSFMSPHFDPWDEIFDIQNDESWKLRWSWKICDIDHVCGKKINLEI